MANCILLKLDGGMIIPSAFSISSISEGTAATHMSRIILLCLVPYLKAMGIMIESYNKHRQRLMVEYQITSRKLVISKGIIYTNIHPIKRIRAYDNKPISIDIKYLEATSSYIVIGIECIVWFQLMSSSKVIVVIVCEEKNIVNQNVIIGKIMRGL